MKFAIALTLLLLCCPVPARAAADDACKQASGIQTVEDLTAPDRANPKRKAILDVLRSFVKRMSDLDVIFVVSHLKVGCGWAWIEAEPQSADGTQHYESMQALLARRDGNWQYVESPPEWSECDADPDCVDRSRYFRKLAAKHPGLASGIFPVDAPSD